MVLRLQNEVHSQTYLSFELCPLVVSDDFPFPLRGVPAGLGCGLKASELVA